jgi:hypothetical protein
MFAALILGSFLLPFAEPQVPPLPPPLQQVQPLPEAAERENTRLAVHLSPAAAIKVDLAAAKLGATARRHPDMTAVQLQNTARASVLKAFPGLQESNIDAVVFLAVAKCAHDLQAEMERTSKQMLGNAYTRDAEQKARPVTNEHPIPEYTNSDFDRAQMMREEWGKLLYALGNVMLAASNTDPSVIGSLK